MAVKVRIFSTLKKFTDGQEELDAEPGTIISLVRRLDEKYKGIGEKISDNGAIQKFVNIYLNGTDIRSLGHGATEVKEGDEVSIIPAIDGG
jgi:molybdopterin converting factor small subunit